MPLLDIFADIADPRVERTRHHKLLDILTIAVLGVLCGADGFQDFERFGKAKAAWLRTFLELPNGIPSHDTFGRVFARLDPDELNAAFARWMSTVMTALNGEDPLHGEHLAVDGKRLRRSFTGGKRSTAAHIVNAWACHSRLVLAQLKVDGDSNEITAIPTLLSLLSLKGCIVSIDAMGTQKDIAAQIVADKGDYLLAIKGNHPHFHDQLHRLFDNLEEVGIDHDYAESEDTGHDRDERRRVWCISMAEAKTVWSEAEVAEAEKWAQLGSVLCLESERQVLGKAKSLEQRYFVCSRNPTASKALDLVRGHWGVENRLHWRLDVIFREDDSRARNGHSAENLSLIRKIALNTLKREPSKDSVRGKRLRAGWDNDYLATLLGLIAKREDS